MNNKKNNPKELFKIVNELRDVKQESVLPTTNSDVVLANKFLIYFKDKTVKIKHSFAAYSEYFAPESIGEGILNAFDPVMKMNFVRLYYRTELVVLLRTQYMLDS